MASYVTQLEKAVQRLLATRGALGTHAAGHFSGDVLINETWSINATAPDTTNTWTIVQPGLGTVTVQTTNGVRHARIRATATTEDPALYAGAANQPIAIWPATLPLAATTHRLVQLKLEWSALLPGLANLDNTNFFMGLGVTPNVDRASANIAGFYLASDVMRTLTDVAGTEETNAFTNPASLTVWHRYAVVGDPTSVRFYLDGTLVATHTSQIALAGAVGPSFVIKPDVAGTFDLLIGMPFLGYSSVVE